VVLTEDTWDLSLKINFLIRAIKKCAFDLIKSTFRENENLRKSKRGEGWSQITD